MTLDAVNRVLPARQSACSSAGSSRREPHFTRWLEHPSSNILHHEQRCCEEARLWFLSYARSMEIGVAPQFEFKAPTWLSQLFEWGPSEWPISWCQVVREKIIDCGVFAALAREVFRAQGLEAHPAQALLSYNASCTGHWQEYWDQAKKKKKKETSASSSLGSASQVVYHEICVLETRDGSARFYDSTWGHWYLPQARAGFNSLARAALGVLAPAALGRPPDQLRRMDRAMNRHEIQRLADVLTISRRHQPGLLFQECLVRGGAPGLVPLVRAGVFLLWRRRFPHRVRLHASLQHAQDPQGLGARSRSTGCSSASRWRACSRARRRRCFACSPGRLRSRWRPRRSSRSCNIGNSAASCFPTSWPCGWSGSAAAGVISSSAGTSGLRS